MKFEFWVFIKGMLMGAADIVPGVSGGTIAFITGIYSRLLHALKMFLPALLVFLRTKRFKSFLKESDLIFLLTLFAGILVSVVSLAKIISYLMVHHPVPLWSSFFGLILASVFVVGRDIRVWSMKLIVSLFIGVVVAYGITQLSPASIDKTLYTIFFSGFIAICAMVLPGISGSFILVILGSYSWVLDAIKVFEWSTLGVFMCGCVAGLLSIANILSWAFDKYKDITLSVLTGFMLGAIVKVWPWREVLSYRQNSAGELIPLTERPVLPAVYEEVMSLDSQLGLAVFCMIVAAILVVSLSLLSDKKLTK